MKRKEEVSHSMYMYICIIYKFSVSWPTKKKKTERNKKSMFFFSLFYFALLFSFFITPSYSVCCCCSSKPYPDKRDKTLCSEELLGCFHSQISQPLGLKLSEVALRSYIADVLILFVLISSSSYIIILFTIILYI